MNKTIFISGGSRGIGKGIAEEFAKDGYAVAFTYNTQLEEAEKVKEYLESSYHVPVYYRQASMQVDGTAEDTIHWAVETLRHIDVLVCNAGLTVHNSIYYLEEDEIDFAFNLDYLSYLICIRETIKHMKEQKIKGRILMISSTRGIRAYPEDPLYGGMKAALHRACASLALETAGDGITINCIAPGNTATRGTFTMEELTKGRFQQKIPLGRAGTPREVGCLAKYLTEEESGYITGTVFQIDGGLILPVMPADALPDAGPGWHELSDRFKTSTLYIGRYSKTEGISVCQYRNGKITEAQTLPYVEDPSYLTVNQGILYSVMETAEYNGINGGACAAFQLGSEAKLLNIQNTNGKHPCHILTDSARTMLFAANYTEGTVSAFLLNPDGTIGSMCGEIKHEGTGPNPKRQERPHMHYLRFMENESILCVSDLGTDRLAGYAIKKEKDAIRFLKKFEIKVPDGYGPRHFVCSKNLKFIYVVNELNNTICVFQQEEDNCYTLLQAITTLPKDSPSSSTAAIRMTKDGKFIYASNRGHDSITVYQIQENGLLKLLQNISSGGKAPRDIAFDKSEAFLLCANQGSNTITALKHHTETGILSEAKVIYETEHPVCLLFA